MGASHSSWWCSTICSALVHHHDAWFLAAQFLCQNLVAQKDQLAKQKDAVVKMNAKRSLGLKTVDLTHEVFTQNSPISNNRPEMVSWDIYRPEWALSHQNCFPPKNPQSYFPIYVPNNSLSAEHPRAIHGLSEVRSSTPYKLTPRPWADQKIEGWTEIEERHIYIFIL